VALPSFGEAVRVWLRVGCLSFGGPAGQIALLHREVVDERAWIGERRFLHALNFCTLLPGPEAQQLATYLGWLMHGVKGGLAAGLLFVVPGALVMLALSVLYASFGEVPLVASLFFGLKCAVLVLVVEALLRVGRRALKGPAAWTLAGLAFVALFAVQVPFPFVVLAAGLVGALVPGAFAPAHHGEAGGDAPARLDAVLQADPARPGRLAAQARRAGLAALALWLLPVALLALAAPGTYADVALFFSTMAVVTLGGAYAVLAYVAQEAVGTYGWLSGPEMLTGLGLAETTPGPTILVNQFVGFLAAMRAPDPFQPYVAATLGALMTLWVTFAPSFLWIFVGGPYLERIVANRRLAGALSAITAAVVGVIATLAVRFGLSVLFGSSGTARLGPIALPWPDWSSLQWDASLLAFLAAIVLFRLHWGVVWTVAASAAAGLALTLAR
jgi:chromate transporter